MAASSKSRSSRRGDARAFSRAQVVHLGRSDTAPSKDDLRDLYVRHRPWKLPLDAIIVIAVELGVIGTVIWWLVRR